MEGDAEMAAAAVALPKSLVPRAYQIEMFEESMKRNTIVVMDTGSGKTQIAVLRIAAELDRCPNHKIVWFTVPTVALAQQQHVVISRQLPAYQSRLLSGADNVDHWTTQAAWDTVLKNVRIVLSTSQVLVDALTHGFVKLTNIALLVFDEAHHVQSNNCLNQMMQVFYHPKRMEASKQLPNILGLTASPIMNKNPKAVRKLEENLNAKCISPKRHLEELMQYVWRPSLERIEISSTSTTFSECLQSLKNTVKAIPLDEDPYIKYLMKDNRPESQEKLTRFYDGEGNTLPYCIKQLKALCRRADFLLEDLGPWAAEYFIILCARRSSSNPSVSPFALSLEDDEKRFIAKVLNPFAAKDLPVLDDHNSASLSEKAVKLLEFLSGHFNSSTTGLIFVKMRCTAVILAKLISLHPLTSDKYKTLPFVGSSFPSKKADILELTELAVQKEALSKFRIGTCNLITATSVLEEGIDVTATNLVIRFDSPQNLRSYIQSRGRARKQSSRFVVFLSPSDSAKRDWNALEQEMRTEYMKERAMLEDRNEKDKKERGERTYHIKRTSATLTLNNAKSHIQHFCDHLPQIPYSNNRPEYIFDIESGAGIGVTIILPISVDPSVRISQSAQRWQSERMASNDAAFEAYVKLHRAGLVNDNLLADLVTNDDFLSEDYRLAMYTVRARMNPWVEVEDSSKESLRPYKIIVNGKDLQAPNMLLLLPFHIARTIRVPLYRTFDEVVNIDIQPFEGFPGPYDCASISNATRLLLQSLFTSRLDLQTWKTAEFPYLLVPESHRHNLPEWMGENLGTVEIEAPNVVSRDQQVRLQGLLRKTWESGFVPFKADRALYQIPERDEQGHLLPTDDDRAEELHFEIRKIPRNRDFVSRNAGKADPYHHPLPSLPSNPLPAPPSTPFSLPKTKFCPVKYLRMDRLSLDYSDFMLFLPGILHYVEIAAIAQNLSDTILAPIGLTNLGQLMDAISAPSSRGKGDYERLEFWGDCRLKYFASLHLFAWKDLWHEGYLSQEKGKTVSNGRLCKAAMTNNLDRYIHTDQFASHQWRPMLLADLDLSKQRGHKQRLLSSKTLADVVEALLGAIDLDQPADDDVQREQRDLSFLKIFLPDYDWKSTGENLARINSLMPPADINLFNNYAKLEERVLVYKFNNRRLLVQALTHPSCPATSNTGTHTSYERLEFLGDSILDQIVVSRLINYKCARYESGFPPSVLTILRSIAVNADFLAFFCLGFSFEEVRGDIVKSSGGHFSPTVEAVDAFLWQFLRHDGSWEICTAQAATRERYLEHRSAIQNELESCRAFPWALLATIAPEKFFSDIIESITAAIFIDSSGDISAVEQFLERLGVLRYLDKLLDAVGIDGVFKPGSNEDGVMIMQPKMQLYELAGAEQQNPDWSAIEQGQDKRFAGHVSINGVAVGTVEKAQTRSAAESIAADEAVRLILASRADEMADAVCAE